MTEYRGLDEELFIYNFLRIIKKIVNIVLSIIDHVISCIWIFYPK